MIKTPNNRNPLELTNAAIEALRRGRAPDLMSLHGQDDQDVAAMRTATLLALGAGRAPRPGRAFVARLERDLLARQEACPGRGAEQRRTPLPGWARLGRRVGIGLALAVMLAVALLAVRGPRQTLADVRRLLSYVPGLGFVATQEARVLAEPVEVTREGITVRVEQAIAGARDTRLIVLVEAPDITQDREEMTRVPDAGIVLRTAAGNELVLTEWSQSPKGCVLTFEPLPADAESAVLSIRVPPGLPAGGTPEEWTFHLLLRPEGDAYGDAHIVEPYEPAIPGEEHQGVTLRVAEVAHTADETVVRVGIDGYPALEVGMPPQLGGRYLFPLRDEAGRLYARRPAPGVGFEAGGVVAPASAQPEPDAQPPAWQEVLAFEPLHPKARELRLTVDGVDVHVPAEGAFQVDLGGAPQIGDAFPVDVELRVAGATVRLTGATLVREELALRDGVLVRTLLQFDAEQVTPRDEVIVHSLTLSGDRTIVRGSPSHGGPEGIYAVGVELAEGDIPPGVLTLSLDSAGVMLIGPWQFTWSVPPAARP